MAMAWPWPVFPIMHAVWCGRRCSWGQRAASLGSSSAVWLAGWLLKCSYLIGLAFGKRAVEDDRAPSLCGRLLSGMVSDSLERPGVAIFGLYMALWLVASASHWKWIYSIASQAMGGPLKMPLSAFPMPQATIEGDYIRLFYVAGTWSRPRVIGRFCFSSWQTRKMIPSPFFFSLSLLSTGSIRPATRCPVFINAILVTAFASTKNWSRERLW